MEEEFNPLFDDIIQRDKKTIKFLQEKGLSEEYQEYINNTQE